MILSEYKQYFPELTGVRALAAFLVFIHHYNPFSADRFEFLNQLVKEFHVGVSMFFVLSGFLITHRYFNQTEKINWQNYLINRVARVYPMYCIVTTIAFVFAADSSWNIYLLNITFIRGFFDDLKFTLVSQGWSLTVEECFYFLAPVIFLFLRRTQWTLWAMPIFFVSLGIGLVAVFGGQSSMGFFNTYHFMFTYTFFGRCFEFFCGVGLALYFKPISKSGSQFTWIGLLIMISAILTMSIADRDDWQANQLNVDTMINNFLLPISIILFFYGLLVEKTWLKKLLSSKVFIIFGKSSYTFYLIHLGVLSLWLDKLVGGNTIYLFILLNIVSIGLWLAVEEPFNRWIRAVARNYKG